MASIQMLQRCCEKFNISIETEITERIEAERNFSSIIDAKSKELLQNITVMYLNNLNKMKEKI